MIAEHAIRAQIIADATINGLIATRMYPHDSVPQDGIEAADAKYPYVTYQRISTVARPELDGTDEELPRVRVQLDCVGQTDAQVHGLVWEIRRLFRNGLSASGICLARVDNHGSLPRDPDTNLVGARVDLIVTLAAAEAA